MEQIGIIFRYTAARNMIEEYIGDVVINAHEALQSVIEHERQADAHMYERFTEMYKFCSKRWSRRAARRVRYNNVPEREHSSES